jgi:uncharacterized protein YcfJ
MASVSHFDVKESAMKNLVVKSIVSAALVAAAGASFAQTAPATAFGIVISATPVVQQVTVPKQVCTTTAVQNYQPGGGGALIGALVGGALGNQIGRGHGQDSRAVATVVGALGGGFVGNQIEAQNFPTQSCTTQNTIENRTVAQNVLYEYAGQRFNVQMPANGDFRPGTRLTLQLNAPAAAAPAPTPLQVYNTVPQSPVQTVTYVNPVAPVVYYYDSYAPYAPRYFYGSSYYAPRAVNYPVHHGFHHGVRDEHRNWR